MLKNTFGIMPLADGCGSSACSRGDLADRKHFHGADRYQELVPTLQRGNGKIISNIQVYEMKLAINGYGHKPGQYDKSVCYDVPWFRCPGKGQFCKMLYYPFKWIIKFFSKQSLSCCSAIRSFRVVVVDYC